MRFVMLRVEPDQMSEFETYYQNSVFPALHETPGCLFAGLLSSPEHPSECVSMTLWRSPDDVRAYESSGLYAELIEEAEPFLWHSTEWRVRLSDDLKLEYAPVREEPRVEAFPIEADSAGGEAIEHASANMYLRIVSGRVKHGKIEEVTSFYESVVIPALKNVPGCKYAYLARGLEGDDEMMSVTLWDSRTHAAEYEQHGRFRALSRELEPLMQSVSQWRMELDSVRRSETTSEDIHIEGYQVVATDTFGDH